jgi:hypothetical protein
MGNYPVGQLSTVVSSKPYHGFRCSVGRIIESPVAPDKQSYLRKSESSQD